jgi:hypothetical protein
MSDPKEELDSKLKELEDYPRASRWDNLPGDIVITKRSGELITKGLSRAEQPLTLEDREIQVAKFTRDASDVAVLRANDQEDDENNFDESVGQSLSEARWHGEAHDIMVTKTNDDPNYDGPTT